MSDAVEHPPHYTSHPSGVECIQITEHMGFNLGNAVKYLFRRGLKTEDQVEDLKKAAWYLGREIERRSSKKVRRAVSGRLRSLVHSTIGRIRSGEAWSDPRPDEGLTFDRWLAHEPPGLTRDVVEIIWQVERRAGLKGDVVEDLRKARWYIDREIARREARVADAPPS